MISYDTFQNVVCNTARDMPLREVFLFTDEYIDQVLNNWLHDEGMELSKTRSFKDYILYRNMASNLPEGVYEMDLITSIIRRLFNID